MPTYVFWPLVALLACLLVLGAWAFWRKKRKQAQPSAPSLSSPSLGEVIVRSAAITSSGGAHGPGMLDMLSLGICSRTPRTAADWWVVPGKTCVAAYQPKGAASYAASKVNLANPGTYDATEGNAPTWAAATGWTFNGTNQYLYNTVSVAMGLTLALRLSDQTTLRGVYTHGAEQLWVAPSWFGSVNYRYGSLGGTKAPSATAGVFITTPNAGYRNGVLDIAFTAGTPVVTKFAFGARAITNNIPPGVAGFISGNVLAAGIWSGGEFTADEAATLSAAMSLL